MKDQETAKRGRPATGKALSNAERQRAYRERQKAQRNEKTIPAIAAEAALITAIERADELASKLGRANERIKELEAQLAQRNEKPAKVKRHRDQPAAKLPEDKTYTLQGRTGSGKWQNLVAGIYGEEASRQLDRVIDNKIAGSKKQYRLVEDGQV